MSKYTNMAEMSMKLEAELTRLRQIEADAKAAGLIGPDGKFVLPRFSLYRTRDGSLVKPGEWVYHIHGGAVKASQVRDGGGVYATCAEECFKSREAAKAAREEKA